MPKRHLVRLKSDLFDGLQEIATEQARSVTFILAQIVKEHLRKRRRRNASK